MNGSYNLNGWNSAFIQNINQRIGLVVDVSGQYGSPSAPLLDTQRNTHSFSDRNFPSGPSAIHSICPRIVRFSHVNVGLAGVFTSDIGLAYGFGGGMDVKISDKLSVRAGQVDYINIRLSGVGTNNIRVSGGIVAGW